MDKTIKNFLRNLSETRQIWIPLIILFVVLAPALSYLNASGNPQTYILINMTISVLLSIGIIYAVYRITEISPEDRFSQLVGLWLIFVIATIVCIVVLDVIVYTISTNPSAATSSLIQGLMTQDFSLLIYLFTFCIIFVFFILLFYLILSFNFDTFFPFVCVILIIGLYLEYSQIVALGALNIVIAFAAIFLIVFAIDSGLPENEKEAMRQINLTPEKAVVIYALALIVFFLTYLITRSNAALSGSLLNTALEIINILALAIILFMMVFLSALFWTKGAILDWYSKQPKKKAQIYKKNQ